MWRYNDRVALDTTNPIRITWLIQGLWTSDRQELHVTFDAAVGMPASSADRQLFEEAFGHSRVEPRQIREHFQSAIASAARQNAAQRESGFWLSEEGSLRMREVLRAAADHMAFGCGMQILPPLEVAMDSPTLRQMQEEQARRRLAEAQAAGRLADAEQALALLERFQTARRAHPELTAGTLLSHLPPADQGKALEVLLMADAQLAKGALWVVSGEQLLRADLSASPQSHASGASVDHPAELGFEPLTCCGELGPFRSITPAQWRGERWLLAGARQGVMCVKLPSGQACVAYRDDGGPWTMGFNSAICLGDVLWGCHSEAGLVGWKIGQPDKGLWRAIRAEQLLRQDAADRPGHLTPLSEDMALFAVGAALWRLKQDGTVEALSVAGDSPVVGIVDEHQTIAVVCQEGRIIRLDRSTLQVTGRWELGGRVTAVGAMPWIASVRLLAAREDGPIQCLGRDDTLVSQYLGSYRAAPMVAGDRGWVAAVAPDRQRLALWHGWDGSRPVLERSIMSLTHHRIADMAFG